MLESERNLKAKEFEDSGNLESAIEQYEQNVSLGSFAPFPYNRLAIIYKKRRDLDNEIRVLKLLLSIQEKEAKKYKWIEGTKQFDKILKTRDRLQKAQIELSKRI
jgi:hypothetical protein